MLHEQHVGNYNLQVWDTSANNGKCLQNPKPSFFGFKNWPGFCLGNPVLQNKHNHDFFGGIALKHHYRVMLVDVCLLIKPFRGHAETVLDPLVKYSKPNAGNIYYIVGEEWQPFVCGNALSCFGFSAEDTPAEQPALRLVTSVRRCLTSWPHSEKPARRFYWPVPVLLKLLTWTLHLRPRTDI